MNELITERDILDIVGETDPSTIAQILALGATREELEEAACSEDAGVEVVGSETVERLREILAEVAAAEEDEPYARTAEARP
jgi:uncharacterized protein YjgD (DUF1641 family)